MKGILPNLNHSSHYKKSLANISSKVFQDNLSQELNYHQLLIVGSSYRGQLAQQTLATKNQGNLILLVPEKGNPIDPNAIACFIPRMKSETSNHYLGHDWLHAGYLPKNTAAKLAPHWPTLNGVPVAIESRLASSVRTNPSLIKLIIDPHPVARDLSKL